MGSHKAFVDAKGKTVYFAPNWQTFRQTGRSRMQPPVTSVRSRIDLCQKALENQRNVDATQKRKKEPLGKSQSRPTYRKRQRNTARGLLLPRPVVGRSEPPEWPPLATPAPAPDTLPTPPRRHAAQSRSSRSEQLTYPIAPPATPPASP